MPQVRVAVDDTVTSALPDGFRHALFTFSGVPDSEFVVFFESLAGSQKVFVWDSAVGTFLAQTFASAGVGTLDNQATDIFKLRPGRIGQLEVLNDNSPVPGRFRFWIHPTSRTPESHDPRILAGDTVTGELLETFADVDEFVLAASGGEDLLGFVQALGLPGTGELSFNVRDPTSGAILGFATSTGGDSGFVGRPEQMTGRLAIVGSRDYVVALRAVRNPLVGGAPAYRGPYRFHTYTVNRAPEHIPAIVALGDTVSEETLDYLGDIDEFTFTASEGQRLVLFFQGLGRPADSVRAEILGPDGSPFFGPVVGGGTDTSLLSHALGPVTLPSAGVYTIRVMGISERFSPDLGAYRLHLYPVNPSPETAPVQVVLGDSVVGEAIDYPGDIDEFELTVPVYGMANVTLVPGAGASGGLLGLSLTQETTGEIVRFLTTAAGSPGGGSGVFEIAAGTYKLLVDGGVGYRGRYSVTCYAISGAVEVVGDTVAIGDTVIGEAVDLPGDIDVFSFYGRLGDHLNLAFRGLAAQPDSGSLFLTLDFGGGYYPLTVHTPTASDRLEDRQSNRFELRTSGWQRLTVRSADDGRSLPDRGPYAFAILPVSVAPESAAAFPVVGDTVAERIDFSGDFDRFDVSGVAGQGIAISFVGAPWLVVVDSATGDTLKVVYGLAGERSTGLFFLPAAGRARVDVFEARTYGPGVCGDAVCSGSYGHTGSYRFIVFPISPGPEVAAATFTIGDTVRGEAVYPAGDVDEFASLGPAGDTLSPWYRLTANPVPSGSLITLEVVDPGTGAVLVGRGVSLIAASTQYFSPGSFVVPAGGAYRIRVRGGGSLGDEVGTAPYEFFVKRGP